MNLAQLRHLIALADHRSFTKAAEAVHLTQPALSRSIKSLEDELGVLLIDRVGRHSEVSTAGWAVVASSRHIVREAEELRNVARQMAGGHVGKIGIGLGGTPGIVLTAPLLRTFAVDYPKVRLTLLRAPAELLVESLRARKLDLLVVDAKGLPPGPDLNVQVLPDMMAGFFVRSRHPLARKKSVSIEELQAFPIALGPLSLEHWRLFGEMLHTSIDPESFATLNCDEIGSLVQVMLDCDVVLATTAISVAEHLAKRRVRCLPIWPAMAKISRFAVVTLANRSEMPIVPLIRDFIVERLKDSPLKR